jgi:hypothetical protein
VRQPRLRAVKLQGLVREGVQVAPDIDCEPARDHVLRGAGKAGVGAAAEAEAGAEAEAEADPWELDAQ